MDPRFSAAPLGSRFIVHGDKRGPLRLSWLTPHQGGFWRWYAVGMLCLFSCVPGIFMLANGPANVPLLIIRIGIWVVVATYAILGLYRLLAPPLPEHLVLTDDLLELQPGFFLRPDSCWRGWLEWPRPLPKKRVFFREDVTNVLLRIVDYRERLTVDVGRERIEIGAGLSETEREWLAEVLKSWVRTPPSTNIRAARPISLLPDPPPGFSFVVDVDKRHWPRLTWQVEHPGPWEDGGIVARIAAAVPLILFALMCVAGEAYFLWSLIAEEFLTWGVHVIGPILCLIALTLWNCYWVRLVYLILRPARPERLVFAGEMLEYDPGFAHVRDARPSWFHRWNFMELRVRPKRADHRSVIRVSLERNKIRQRLVVEAGAAKFEIGSGLTEPEREWLAERLRAWAGPSAD